MSTTQFYSTWMTHHHRAQIRAMRVSHHPQAAPSTLYSGRGKAPDTHNSPAAAATDMDVDDSPPHPVSQKSQNTQQARGPPPSQACVPPPPPVEPTPRAALTPSPAYTQEGPASVTVNTHSALSDAELMDVVQSLPAGSQIVFNVNTVNVAPHGACHLPGGTQVGSTKLPTTGLWTTVS